MLSSSRYTMLKLSKTTSPDKLFDHDCVTLYVYALFSYICLIVYIMYWTDYSVRWTMNIALILVKNLDLYSIQYLEGPVWRILSQGMSVC